MAKYHPTAGIIHYIVQVGRYVYARKSYQTPKTLHVVIELYKCYVNIMPSSLGRVSVKLPNKE